MLTIVNKDFGNWIAVNHRKQGKNQEKVRLVHAPPVLTFRTRKNTRLRLITCTRLTQHPIRLVMTTLRALHTRLGQNINLLLQHHSFLDFLLLDDYRRPRLWFLLSTLRTDEFISFRQHQTFTLFTELHTPSHLLYHTFSDDLFMVKRQRRQLIQRKIPDSLHLTITA